MADPAAFLELLARADCWQAWRDDERLRDLLGLVEVEGLFVTAAGPGYSRLLGAEVETIGGRTSWPEDHRTWIAPDIYAPPTFQAFRRNQDPAMDAILALREHLPGR